jgi:membrane-associated protein
MERFIPVILTLMPMIAGYRSYQLRKILILYLADPIVWIGTLVPLGYSFGRSYLQIINHSAWVLVGIVLIATFPMLQLMV